MRIAYSKKNAFSAMIVNIIKILLGFFAQKVFIMTLGTEFLGLNSLFNNIISMLAITELGIGTAIIYCLYDPIAKNDIKRIKQLLNYYRKTYRIIVCVMLLLGICVIPFLPYLTNNSEIKGIAIFYLLFLGDVLLSYVIAYKSSLINAFQKNYVINIIHMIYLLLMNMGQIIFLILTKNYIIYLIIKIISRIIENLFISIFYKKQYTYIENAKLEPMSKNLKEDINKKVKALFLHKIAIFLVTGTDNLIISKLFGLIVVGLYSNYHMIINSIQSLFSQVFNSIVASIGNLLVEKNRTKSYDIYEKLLFLNYWIISFCSISLYFLIEPFVTLWLGKEYLLTTSVLFTLVIHFYSEGMRNAPSAFKSAAGIFVEDRFVPFIESAVNLITSIFLGLCFGLIGVFIGTILSTLVLHLYSYPKYVYQPLFKRKYTGYIMEQFKYFLYFLLNFVIVFIVCSAVHLNNSFYTLLFNGIICLIIPNLLNFIIFNKSSYLKYYLNIIRKKSLQ